MPGPSTILEAFARHCSSRPDVPAVIEAETGIATNRAQLYERSRGIAARLMRADVSEGALVAIQLPNSVDFPATVLAVWSCGAVAVPIDRDATQSEVATILTHFGIHALVYRASDATIEITRREDSTRLPPEDGIALIKLTSGSSGLPKGILTTEANLVADCANICTSMDLRSSDRNLAAIPFSHSYGFSNLVTPLLIEGITAVATNQYLPLALLEMADRFACSVFPGIPMIFDHLSRTPAADGAFEGIRTFISAGAPLRDHVSKAFRQRFGSSIHSFYGCSECGGIAYDRDGASVERGSVGTPMNGVQLEICTETGRLRVASQAAAKGYAFDVEGEDWRFQTGRFTTDDLARFSDRGEVELVGRVGDLVNIAGKKVNPREVEQVILRFPGVREVKAYGESAGARGDVMAAAIVGEPGLTREAVREFCRLHLSSWKVPRVIKILDQLPVDERGKIKKTLLAEL